MALIDWGKGEEEQVGDLLKLTSQLFDQAEKPFWSLHFLGFQLSGRQFDSLKEFDFSFSGKFNLMLCTGLYFISCIFLMFLHKLQLS